MANIPVNAGKPFTAADDQTIREMHSKGASVASIAGALCRTEPGIEARLEKLGLRKGVVMAKPAAILGA
jgi:hypothetical protein